MGKHKNRHNVKNSPQIQHQSPSHSKGRFSNGVRLLVAFAVLTAIALAFFFAASSQPTAPSGSSLLEYPLDVAPVFFSTPTISSGGDKVSIPTNTLDTNKLTFVDLKLAQTTNILEYQGRTIPLSYYRNGDYLPLVLISTPSGNTIAGIRVCEPCGSFSFHIVKGSNLKCDVCGAEWDVETFAGISGGCLSYPPPKLTSNLVGESVEVDLANLQATIAA